MTTTTHPDEHQLRRCSSRSRRKATSSSIVLTSIATELAMSLLLILGLFAGADKPHIIRNALIALGAGFALLALASTRLTRPPQQWAVQAHCWLDHRPRLTYSSSRLVSGSSISSLDLAECSSWCSLAFSFHEAHH